MIEIALIALIISVYLISRKSMKNHKDFDKWLNELD